MHRLLHALITLALVGLASARPNLLLITVDDMSRDSVGSFGSPIPGITPHIDRLAGEGLSFDQAFVTIAICQPTRAVWMTGRYPHRSGALGFDPISKGIPTLPEALQAGGYHTSLLGKDHHVVPSRHAAFDIIRTQQQFGQGRSPERYAQEITAAIVTAKEAEKPFFIMANAHDPHRPFAGAPSDRYKRFPYPRKFAAKDVPVPGFLPDLPKIREELATYYQSVQRADQVVGAILEALEASGEADNTMVTFMSDHGMPLPFAKSNCYLASTATPWIVRWPAQVKADTRDKTHFISGIDFAPTVLDAAGLPPLAGADGRSIVPLLKGEAQEGRNRVFTVMNRVHSKKEYPIRAINDGDYLYIWNGWSDGETAFRNESMSGFTFKAMKESDNPADRERAKFFEYRCTEELYDLRKDPDCLHNLLNEPGGGWNSRASAMTKALWHWMKDTEDPQIKLFQSQVELALD
ncbi:sulfatase family protein [Haloferula rosea]|uniref:Sulfatase n=1 Tax=Haloferula rosea TaxID=490093 RepID=A0A934R8Q1_9BACT|nr:sulfatase [Haloferula rosea]MBK1827294.1 sulfatase [Haloferula rosea]